MTRGRSSGSSRGGSSGGANRRMVTRTGSDWAVKKPGASRASSIHATQGEAIDRAREILGNNGGGELTVQGRDGKIAIATRSPPGTIRTRRRTTSSRAIHQPVTVKRPRCQ